MQAKGKSAPAPLSIRRTRRECRWEARPKETALNRSDISQSLRFLRVVRNTLTLPLSPLLLQPLSGQEEEDEDEWMETPMGSDSEGRQGKWRASFVHHSLSAPLSRRAQELARCLCTRSRRRRVFLPFEVPAQ